MSKEQLFEPSPRGHSRFFSVGHLDALKRHLDCDGTVSVKRRYVRSWHDPESSFKASLRYAFIREDLARDHNEDFSQKVIISGVIEDERIEIVGSMNSEAEYIEGPFKIDKVFLVTGEYENPILQDITSKLIGVN